MTPMQHLLDPSASFYTFTGIEFHPFAPVPEAILLADIAHALARQCRYGGHVSSWYSVAEHSVLVSTLVPPADALWGLLHDSDEAYLPDLPAPIKRAFPDYQAAGDRLRAVVMQRFHLPIAQPASVGDADLRIRVPEQQALFKNRPRDMTSTLARRACRAMEAISPLPTDIPIVGLPPGQAEQAFLDRFHALLPKPAPARAP